VIVLTTVLKPVHTVAESATICRRKVLQSHFSATVWTGLYVVWYLFRHRNKYFFLDQELISYRYPSFSSCWAELFKKVQRHRCFKSDRDEIWRDCSSSKYASIDGVIFSIWHHTFKMVAIMSFHTEKCCHLMS